MLYSTVIYRQDTSNEPNSTNISRFRGRRKEKEKQWNTAVCTTINLYQWAFDGEIDALLTSEGKFQHGIPDDDKTHL